MESTSLALPLIIWTIIVFISLIITIAALIDILRNEFKGSNDKLIWVLLTILLSPIGGILYFIIGRKQRVDKSIPS